jgi:hypothetical protein
MARKITRPSGARKVNRNKLSKAITRALKEEPKRPIPPAEALQSNAAFQRWLASLPPPPENFLVGQDLDWQAPWIDVTLRVELPFWLMVDNVALPIDVAGCQFMVSLHGESFELHVGDELSDSKSFVAYHGPLKKREELSDQVQRLLRRRPKPSAQWRKCKTVLKIKSRCNEDVWNKGCVDAPFRPSVAIYLAELCRAHIPVVNRLINAYRLSTYDPFPFEVSPWDVPYWLIEHGTSQLSVLVPYRGWDHVPRSLDQINGVKKLYRLTEPGRLRAAIEQSATPGEFELLDAINLMERGNYSDAIRRITTAMEVIVEHLTSGMFQVGKRNQVSFYRRLERYQSTSNRSLPDGFKRTLERTRSLRHRIVHEGLRIGPDGRGQAQQLVDIGRWMFNWFENNEQRRAIREGNVALRSLGRDALSGVFSPRITRDGVLLSPLA